MPDTALRARKPRGGSQNGQASGGPDVSVEDLLNIRNFIRDLMPDDKQLAIRVTNRSSQSVEVYSQNYYGDFEAKNGNNQLRPWDPDKSLEDQASEVVYELGYSTAGAWGVKVLIEMVVGDITYYLLVGGAPNKETWMHFQADKTPDDPESPPSRAEHHWNKQYRSDDRMPVKFTKDNLPDGSKEYMKLDFMVLITKADTRVCDITIIDPA